MSFLENFKKQHEAKLAAEANKPLDPNYANYIAYNQRLREEKNNRSLMHKALENSAYSEVVKELKEAHFPGNISDDTYRWDGVGYLEWDLHILEIEQISEYETHLIESVKRIDIQGNPDCTLSIGSIKLSQDDAKVKEKLLHAIELEYNRAEPRLHDYIRDKREWHNDE